MFFLRQESQFVKSEQIHHHGCVWNTHNSEREKGEGKPMVGTDSN